MTLDAATLEGIARELHEATGGLLPVHAFELAGLCGLEVRGWMRARGARQGETIWYPIRARSTRQHGVVAHEVGHWALERAGRSDSEDAARYLAGALMLPRAPFLRDLAETDWDLFALQDRHPNASAEMIIVRMTQVSPACAWVWDAGKVARRYGVEDDGDAATIVDRVLELEAPVADGPLRAWPSFDGRWRRVLVVRRAA